MSSTYEELHLDIKDYNEQALRTVRRINEMTALLDGVTGHTRETLERDLVDLYQQLYRINMLTDQAYCKLIILDDEKVPFWKKLFRK